MEIFKTIEDILSSDLLADIGKDKAKTDRVLKSTRIENVIFKDLSKDVPELEEYERKGKQKLKSFDSLIKDVFQSIYGLNPRYVDQSEMSAISKEFNRNIIADLMKDDNYSSVKSVCEGKELPSISATEEFTRSLLLNLSSIMHRATGGKGQVTGLDTMEQDKEELMKKLSEFLKKAESANDELKQEAEKNAVHTANRILSKNEQLKNFSNRIQKNMKNKSKEIKEAVGMGVESALNRANEVSNTVLAWGDGSGDMKKNSVNTEILKRTAKSSKLRYIAQFLGRYKEMLNSKRLAGFTYGRGEKYDVEYGNNINSVLTSELAMLSSPELIPLFLRKYQNKGLKQYRKREPEYKGKGDVIVCLDESQSTFGENNAYGMAIAMVLYEICRINNSNFALIHFDCDTKVDYFSKDEQPEPKKVLDCAETFLNGGTDFEKPLKEAISLYESGKMDKPDIVFITDGECDISGEFRKVFAEFKENSGAKLTGILLDMSSCFSFSLQKFADCIYKTSELLKEEIIENIIEERI